MKKTKGARAGLLTGEMFGSRRGKKSQRRRIRRALETTMAERSQYGRRPGRRQEIERAAPGFLEQLKEPAMNDVCRVYFQNIRTLKMEGDMAQGPFGILRAAGVDVIGMSEVNKNWDHPVIKGSYEKGIRKTCGWAGIQVASNEEYKPKGMRKPGGIMMVTSEEVQGKVRRRDNDRLGRWAKVELEWEDLELAVYTVYVPQTGNLGGPATVRRQLQHSREREEERNEQAGVGRPRRSGGLRVIEAMYENLTEEIRRDMEQGREVIVGGDFNEENGEGSRMKRFMEGVHLVNVYEARMGEVPATRYPGRRTIDHVWASLDVMGRIGGVGIVPRDEVFLSDHVGLFLDILTGESSPRLESLVREARGLKSGNARSVRKYVEGVKTRVEGREVERCLDKLEEVDVQQDRMEEMEQSLNDVDEMVQGILIRSEQELKRQQRKLFTPEVKRLQAEKRYWAKLRKAAPGVTHQELARVWAGHEEDNWKLTDRDMRDKLREVNKRIKAYEKVQDRKRREFLEELAELRGAQGNEAVAKAIREINRRECQAREAWRIKDATKGMRANELPEVQVPDGGPDIEKMWEDIKGDGERPEKWESIRGASKVNSVLAPWCAKHFNQAEGTPFTRGRWVRDLDIGAERNKVDEIVAGGQVADEADGQVCQEWIEEMRRKKEGTPEVELIAKFEDFKRFASQAKESKGGGPSGRHYGHYKVLAQEEDILRIVFRVMALALKHGVVLRRWEMVHQQLIKKDRGSSKIHRFRNITLVEIDLMFVMKVVWAKELGMKMHEERTLNEAQYARREQVAQNSVLNKRLSYDLQLILREESFQSDNDAMSCYDRIVDDIAVLACMRMGLGRRAGRFLKKVLTHFRHQIVIGGSPSEEYFKNEVHRRIHGTGQGTGWSPTIWSAVCDIIITLCERHYPGQLFRSPDGEVTAKQNVDAFVDDSNLSVNEEGVKEFNKEHKTAWEMVRASWEAMSGYEQYLFASGGQLAMEKCNYYWLQPTRVGTRYEFARGVRKDLKFKVGNSERETELNYLEPTEEHKILGVWISPSGRRKRQVQDMERKAKEWADKMMRSGLPPYLKERSYNQQLWPQISYAIGLSLITKGEARRIMAPALSVLKSSKFLSRTFSGDLLRLPDRYGGYGVKDLYVSSVIEQTKMVISSIRGSDNTARKMQILISYHQQELGLRMSIFDDEAAQFLDLLTETWLVEVIRRARSLGLRINVNQKTEWAGTAPTIMEEVLQWDIQWEAKKKLNLCRLARQVVYRDDLYSRDGKFQRWGSRMGTRSTLKWPAVRVPRTWKTWWDEVMEEAFPEEIQGVIQWKDRQEIVRPSEATNRESPRAKRACRKAKREAVRLGIDEPAGSPRVERPTASGPRKGEGPVGQAERELIKRWLEDGKLVCASDASVKGRKKAVAVWFGKDQTDQGVMVTESVRGEPHDSGRAEMKGPVIVAETLEQIAEESGVTGNVKVWTDSAEAVQWTQKGRVKNLPSRSCARNVDLKLRWASAHAKYGGEVEVVKVKAHQDDGKKYEELGFEAKRNVDCDEAAGRKVDVVEAEDFESVVEEAVGAMLWTPQGGITGDPYKWVEGERAQAVVCRRLRISERTYDLIDWEAHERALATIGKRERTLIKKMLWGELPTGKRLARNGHRSGRECALCGEEDSGNHYLSCPWLVESREQRRVLGVMKGRLAKLRVNPYMGKWIEESLSGKTPVLEEEKDLSIRRVVHAAFDDQNSIGWDHLTKGRVSISMAKLQGWWKWSQAREGIEMKMGSDVVVRKALGIALMTRHELWKSRSRQVVDKEGPARIRLLRERIGELASAEHRVERRDRGLFHGNRIPCDDQGEDRMRDWVEAVERSITRQERSERTEDSELARTMQGMMFRGQRYRVHHSEQEEN